MKTFLLLICLAGVGCDYRWDIDCEVATDCVMLPIDDPCGCETVRSISRWQAAKAEAEIAAAQAFCEEVRECPLGFLPVCDAGTCSRRSINFSL